ncbi:MAG TPA: C25 family cysteine peptidase, partial [Candidatus Eisenbacteria bacterium]|nr:C25 family cysteine peptidase [Candidatus Eisenbacteria bacterium]
YDNWNAKFLMLFGDGSEDPQNFMGESSPDFIPVHKINGPVAIQFGYEIIPSDPWYVCMENCDLGGVEPVLQDLFIGRAPVQTLAAAQAVVAKLVAYENFASDQIWRQSILLSDDDAYSAETFFGGGPAQLGYCYRPPEVVFRQLNETVATVIQDDAGLQQAVLDTFHLDSKLHNVACHPSSPDCTCKDQPTAQQITHSSITPDLISRLNAGRMWWNFQGHANEFVLAHEDLYINRGGQDDKDLLMNDGRPFLFSAFSCHANAFARFGDRSAGRGPALGEEMATLPVRGAIGSWASTGYEILPFSGTSHINVSWARAMFEDPPHDPYLGQGGSRVVLGETIALALARYVPTVVFNPNEKGIGLSYHLLGDPATRLSIGPPQAAVTANTLPVADDQPIRLHTLGDTLRLEADLVSNVALTSIALERNDPSGTVVIPSADYTLTPAFPDTNGASGGRRYHLTYRTTLRPVSYSYTFVTTDRYGVTGRFDAVFQFLSQLLLNNTVLADNDPVPPSGNVALRFFSPKPLVPASDLILTINGVNQPFTAAPVPGDASGREWVLSWTHAPYAIDTYSVALSVAGGGTHTHVFRVLVGGGELQVQNPVAFPNPFDEEGGTAFSFTLVSGAPVDLLIRVFTTNGKLIYERDERGLTPGYHQLPWDGRDDEGDLLANGVYVYRMLATNGPSKAEYIGRLVKLRKPHRADTQ